MSGLLSDRRGTTLYLLVWLLLGCVFAGMILSVGAGSTGATLAAHPGNPALARYWLNALLLALPVTMVYAFATGFSAFALCRAFPLAERSLSSLLGVFGLAALVLASLWVMLGHLWNEILLTLELPWAGLAFSANLSWLMFALGLLLYGLTVALHYLLIEYERAQLAAQRELESKIMATDAELRMLRTQVDPHFLFNSLNSISALTSIDAQKAREMTQQLADFFRLSLGLEAHKKVSLQDEMRLTMHFLAIEKVRFDARLQVQMHIADDAAPGLLPPMIIQPLVENAVKHGIGQLTQGGTIHIHAARAGSLLRIRVENDIDADLPADGSGGVRSGAGRGGIGLANVRQRLFASYAHEASIHWQRSNTTFCVELTLPFETR
jgi:two-component sensor histidine kinase